MPADRNSSARPGGGQERLPGDGELQVGGTLGERLGEQLGQPVDVELVAGGGEGVEEGLDPRSRFGSDMAPP